MVLLSQPVSLSIPFLLLFRLKNNCGFISNSIVVILPLLVSTPLNVHHSVISAQHNTFQLVVKVFPFYKHSKVQ